MQAFWRELSAPQCDVAWKGQFLYPQCEGASSFRTEFVEEVVQELSRQFLASEFEPTGLQGLFGGSNAIVAHLWGLVNDFSEVLHVMRPGRYHLPRRSGALALMVRSLSIPVLIL
jgi:hypothetical protein